MSCLDSLIRSAAIARTDRIPGIPATSCSHEAGNRFWYPVLQSVIVLKL
ncbi:hypothetical protein L798_02524 [Zootermopsis nevadensis]|uniref:Uncharacterized protein n=1 Tax=Zootermopsis nevadensis TaxID=136037 RepID=A0A067QRU1_ZOONE|nr:hypothetical protein L798_02524 [Zootermopsis nevadensis]